MINRDKVTRNPLTGTVRVPRGKSYNVSTNQPQPQKGCAVVAFGMVAIPVLPAIWVMVDWLA